MRILKGRKLGGGHLKIYIRGHELDDIHLRKGMCHLVREPTPPEHLAVSGMAETAPPKGTLILPDH